MLRLGPDVTWQLSTAEQTLRDSSTGSRVPRRAFVQLSRRARHGVGLLCFQLSSPLPALPWGQHPALCCSRPPCGASQPRPRQCRACPAGVSSGELFPTKLCWPGLGRAGEEGLCSARCDSRWTAITLSSLLIQAPAEQRPAQAPAHSGDLAVP